eukprot:TRINITY_DN23836_c0_g1_i2.p1 TRINITY_DN23836_c0_g1~~TRINITY_DN23836_c0_g1_i2.p1  ORF type:complete len:647 (+),score=266.93 TRINITY_DN23836_c0_g1_i2:67-1941(+)
MSEWETPRTLPTLQERKVDKVKFDPRVTTISSKPTNQENTASHVLSPLPQFPPTMHVPTFPPSHQASRPKPKVACINPTPQLEVGTLSPLISPSSRTTTPRIPLGELDQSSLSQRLFHSPAPQYSTMPEASSHYNHPQPTYSPTASSMLSSSYNTSSYSTSKLCHTQVSPSLPSPSLLLQTQLPPSGRSGRDRRHQLNTERQLVALQQQVEQLGTMLCTRQLAESNNSSLGGVYQQQLEQLEQEREELEHLLEEREHQLATFKNSLAALNAEYLSDLAIVKQEARELGEKVKEREDKYAKLEREHQKGLKTIHGLQAYIRTLPAEEEVRELRAKLEARTGEVVEMGVKGTELEGQAGKIREELNSSERTRLELEIENKELLERNLELQNSVNEVEKRRYQARNLGEEQVELLIFDKNELEHENKKLKNLLEWKSKKFEDEKHKLEEHVKRLGGLLEQSNKELQVTSSKLRQTTASNNMQEAELKKKMEANTTLYAKLDKFGAEIQSLRSNNESTARLDGHYTRLTRGMGRCMAELSSLNDLCNQVVGGGDPNMSVLLGVREVGIAPSPLNRDITNLTMEDKLELVRTQLEEVSRVQGEVKELRTRIADKYAENLADNMTSCVTQ